MKAITYHAFGPPEVLQVTEIEKPIPKDPEICLRVKATSVGFGEVFARNFMAVGPGQFSMPFVFWLGAKFFFGWRKPRVKILGSVFSGEVESMGKSVEKFKPGNQVFGYIGQNMGTYAEFICLSESGCVAPKPENMSHEEAALAVYGPIMALPLMKKANIKPGHKVLIVGASGGIGAAAVQIARHYGATVTGVCGTHRIDFVKSLGADKVIDYKHNDFTQSGETYDLIFDVLGRSSFARCKNSLTPNGVYFLASFKMKQLFQMLWTKLSGGKKVICSLAPGSVEDLIAVKELIEAGKFKSLIDRRFTLEEMAMAHQYYESAERKGNVAITIKQSYESNNF
ncbi:MAG: NAD(P)-dependent alcohol dehydrogenase [Bacteroidetes bacterium]|nr:MAG: NAD(P)-dependent alcohol dehydrogenase [Bacteroidota bacterium]